MTRRPDEPTLPAQEAQEPLEDAASKALDDGRPQEALLRAEEALARHPRSVPALHLRAAALEELGRIDEARQAYRLALGAGKDDPELLLGVARFLVDGLPEEEQEKPDLEEGLRYARRGGKLASKAGDPALAVELALVEARALSQLGWPEEALPVLEHAAGAAPDDALVRLEQGIALYELCRFGEARAALALALDLDPDDPLIAHELGLVAERQGDKEEARRRFAMARRLSPEEFPSPPSQSHAAFEAAVEDALGALPEGLRTYLMNVAVTVEDLPAEVDLKASDPPLSPGILGLFRGAPYGQKASMDPWSHLPSSIVLYQKNLERAVRTRAELVEQIRITLVHEVGHFLGLSEDELYQRGLE